MRYVPSLPPVTTVTEPRQVRALVGVRPVRPIQSQEEAAAEVEQRNARQENRQELERRQQQRRAAHQPVIIDVRSGPEDRRGDHLIDEIV